jgi:hypothetical protein
MSQAARRHPHRGSIHRMVALPQLQRPQPRSAMSASRRVPAVPVRPFGGQESALLRHSSQRPPITALDPKQAST